MPTIQYELIGNTLMKFVEESKDISDDVKMLADKLSESAEKSAEKITHRHKQILEFMKKDVLYSSDEIADAIGLKGPRTRQLLNELVKMGIIECTAVTKNRRYIKR